MRNLTKQFLGLVLLFMAITSCTKNEVVEPDSNPDSVEGKGAIITRTLSVANFNKVDLAMATNITIKQGSSQEVKAIGQANIIDLISTSVSSDMWKITTKKDVNVRNYKLSFEITVPNLDKLLISGSGNAMVEDFKNQRNLTMEITGSGKIAFNKFEGIKLLNLLLKGSGSITANKDIVSLTNLSVIISGSGDYNGFPISTDDNIVKISGAGNVKLTANKTLKVTISGSGNVNYKGNPTITKNISSSGGIINAN